jgi:hypothetical protein
MILNSFIIDNGQVEGESRFAKYPNLYPDPDKAPAPLPSVPDPKPQAQSPGDPVIDHNHRIKDPF